MFLANGIDAPHTTHAPPPRLRTPGRRPRGGVRAVQHARPLAGLQLVPHRRPQRTRAQKRVLRRPRRGAKAVDARRASGGRPPGPQHGPHPLDDGHDHRHGAWLLRAGPFRREVQGSVRRAAVGDAPPRTRPAGGKPLIMGPTMFVRTHPLGFLKPADHTDVWGPPPGTVGQSAERGLGSSRPGPAPAWLKIDRVLADLAARLVTDDAEDLDEAVNHGLRDLGQTLLVDRATVWRVARGGAGAVTTHGWTERPELSRDVSHVAAI